MRELKRAHFKNSDGKKEKTSFIHRWGIPKGSSAFFLFGSDADFKKRHPVGYVFVVIFGIAAFLLPMMVFGVFASHKNPTSSGVAILPGVFGGIISGIGTFNLVALIVKQYLGHLVTIVSFLIGGALMAICYCFMI